MNKERNFELEIRMIDLNVQVQWLETKLLIYSNFFSKQYRNWNERKIVKQIWLFPQNRFETIHRKEIFL